MPPCPSSAPGEVPVDIMSENFYTRLGITLAATEKDIKTAYRKLALKYHPDKNKESNASEMFKSLTEAYTTLADQVCICLRAAFLAMER